MASRNGERSKALMSFMELSTALDFARARNHAVLTTIRNDTRPQLSNVLHHVDEHGVIRISITAERAKYKNLSRRPWAVLHVSSDDFWSYAVIEADVTLSAVAEHQDDDAVHELVGLFRAVQGEHPDWDDFRRAMIQEQRVVARLHPTRAYGAIR